MQEEVGGRGARFLGQSIQPDITIAVEGTSAGDMPGISEVDAPVIMGKGLSITIMDRSLMANREIVKRIERCAKENKIEYQIKKPSYGGTDAGVIIGSRSSVISVPCRYIHSSISIAKKKDIKGAIELLKSFLTSDP